MIETSYTCHANGKLLLTGEYFVLDGALALAVPTVYGQLFSVSPAEGKTGSVSWESKDRNGKPWFTCKLQRQDGGYEAESAGSGDAVNRLIQVIQAAADLRPELAECGPIKVETMLEFPLEWGLGSSSTLLHCIASWLEIDSYHLMEATFGGSGYDLACAAADGPVLYRVADGKPAIEPVQLDWPFKDHLHFVYLENKQDSREGIWHYQNHFKGDLLEAKTRIDNLTKGLVECRELANFLHIVDTHEAFIAESLDLARVKGHRFPEFHGSIKSLGAWGGDFVLAASADRPQEVRQYFRSIGYPRVFSWSDLILEQ